MPTYRRSFDSDELVIEIGLPGYQVEDVWLDARSGEVVVCGWWGDTRVKLSAEGFADAARSGAYRVVNDNGGG